MSAVYHSLNPADFARFIAPNKHVWTIIHYIPKSRKGIKRNLVNTEIILHELL